MVCHPLLDFDLYEVPWTIRMVAGYTRELARAGYPALRFDFATSTGYGPVRYDLFRACD